MDHAIPQYQSGFGAIKLYFCYKDDSPGVEHFQRQDVERNITSSIIKVKSGLYGIHLTSENASRSYYRMMGECMYEGRSKILIANPYFNKDSTHIQLVHHDRTGKKTLIKAQPMKDQMCAIENPLVKNKNCEPGILQIQVNAGGIQQNFQRNIGYGGTHGGQQFLIGAEPRTFLPPDPIIQV